MNDPVRAVAELLGAVVLGLAVVYGLPAPAEIPAAIESALAREIMRQEFGDEMLVAAEADFTLLPRNLSTATNPMSWMLAGYDRCGSITLDTLEGEWEAGSSERGWTRTSIVGGQIRTGVDLVEEYCAVHVVEQTDRAIVFVALHHEDAVHDPGDAWLTYVRATRDGDRLSICVDDDLDHLDSGTFCESLVPVSSEVR